MYLCKKQLIFATLFLVQFQTSSSNGDNSLLRPKGFRSNPSENDLGSSGHSCPGQGACLTKAECQSTGGTRKMGVCPRKNEVCCKVSALPQCGGSSTEWVTDFMTPGYPDLMRNGSTECLFTVLPLPGACAMKIEFKDVVMKASTKFGSTRKCIDDTFFILNIPNVPIEPKCDLKNYTDERLCGRQLIYDSPLDENQLSPEEVSHHRAEKVLIVNGQTAEGHEFPWQVSINHQGNGHRCGASIIRRNLILTAAHCFHGYSDLDKLSIRFGTANGTLEGAEEAEIVSIVQHYEYKPFKSHLNDITLIRLKKNLTYSTDVQPICLPHPEEKFESGEGIVSGWGLLSGDPNASSPIYLQKIGVNFLPNSDCSERMIDGYARTLGKTVHVDPINRSQICAISPKNTSICFGDSGGPMVALNTSDGTYRQVGLVSYGVGRCTIKFVVPVVYSRVTEFLKFIAIAAMY